MLGPSQAWYEYPPNHEDEDYLEYLNSGGHPESCRCPECDPDWHRDVAMDR